MQVGEGDVTRDSLLDHAVSCLAAGDDDAARSVLSELAARDADRQERPGKLTSQIFTSALARRLSGVAPEVNAYLRHYDPPSSSLFNLLATQLPFIGLPATLANSVLEQLIVRAGDPVVLDIGIGSAQQEVALLRSLAAAGRLPDCLHVVAVEPSATSLDEAERRLGAVCDAVGVTLRFTGIWAFAQAMDDAMWEQIAGCATGDRLIVNAAYSAHYLQGTGSVGAGEARDRFFARLRTLEPGAVVLCEQSSDHLEGDLQARYESCRRHYGALFELIDAVDAPVEDRAAMKLFFGREIDDILGGDEDTRVERHETSEAWLARLTRAGFVAASGFEAATGTVAADLRVAGGPGHATLCAGDNELVSVICAGSGPVALDLEPVAAAASRSAQASLSSSPAGSRRVGDIMDREPVLLSETATLAEAAEFVWSSGASDLVVVDAGGSFVGVLSEGDLMRALVASAPSAEDGDGSRVEEFELLALAGHRAARLDIGPLIIRHPVVLRTSDDLMLATSEMLRRQIRRLPVMGDDGRLVGTLARADVVRALLR